MNTRRLGRGLDDLLQTDETSNQASLNQLPVGEISPNPHQPRQEFDEEKLAELTRSIEKQGVVEPIVVRPYPDGDTRYMIVAGERRWRAACQADLETIPGIVRDLDPSQAYVLSLVENIQRENLSPIEEAEAYGRLVEEESFNQEDVAEAVGKSRSAVANRLRLLSLSDSVRDALRDGEISAGHARALLPLEDDEADRLLEAILSDDLSVRETERLVREVKETATESESASNGTAESAKDEKSEQLKRLEAELESNLGASVSIRTKDRKKGDIIIHFESPDEFEALKERLSDRTAV